MSKHYESVDEYTLDMFWCNHCNKNTEHHRYLVKGWTCKECNNH